MNRAEVVQTIRDVGIIPVVRAQSADEAMKAIDAIRAGGVSLLEITMTVPGAVGVIEEVSQRYGGEALIGAGTVLDAETARACILASVRAICTRLCALISPSPAVSIGKKIISGNRFTTAVWTPSDCEDGMQPNGFSASTMWHRWCVV